MKEGEVDLKSITEEAKIENIAVITDFVNSILEANGCSAKSTDGDRYCDR